MANKVSSCSPISTRPNCNNARNSEINNPMRRSFSGNPFTKPLIIANARGFSPNTPANSPSDYPRRNSIGRESIGSLRDYEDKENGKDPNSKPARVRSPAAVSKGTKNFMSPTISAASKINATPRKKVLVERNESIRSSVSFSETKSPISSVILMEENDSKEEMGSNQKKIEEASHDSVITDLCREEALKSNADSDSNVHLVDSKSDTDLLSETVTMEKDCANADGSFKISPRVALTSSSPIVAPLDADPSMLPYDPKTNYLSPRPQFLHYRPNPRIERYLSKEKEGMSLEESFVSESFSDTEVSEEVLSEEDSQKESEDVSLGEMVNEEAEDEEEEEELYVSEPNHISSTHMPTETVEVKGVSKPHFFTRSNFTVLLLAFVIACVSVSVTDSPLIDRSVLNNVSFELYVPPEMIKFAKSNINGVAQNFRLWSANSFSYICKLISDIRGVHQLGPLQYVNLTDLLEDHLVDGYLVFDQSDLVTADNYQQNVFGPVREREVETEAVKENSHPQIEADKDIEDEAIEAEDTDPEFEEQVHQEITAHENTEDVLGEHCEPEPEPEEVHLTEETEAIKVSNSEAEQTKERADFAAQLDIELQSNNICLKDQPVEVLQTAEVQPEVSKAGEPQDEIDSAEIESTKAEDNPISELDASSENPQSFGTVGFTIDGLKDKISVQNLLGATLVVLSILAATAFTYAKRGRPSTPSAAILVEQPVMTKKLDHSPMSVSGEHTIQERLSSQNWQSEFDMVEESCPSEMSSFQKSSTYSKKELRGLSEAQSQERKPRKNQRRESLASSDYSIGSFSYGSFTTYEKLPSKHGNGEEEVITPVRRSSRIRSHVSSP